MRQLLGEITPFGRDNAIAQYELQVMEHGAEIVQRNTVIAFIQE